VQVWRADTAGRELLGESPKIDKDSLSRDGVTIGWRAAGAVETATLK
jgi:hypothetical protein